MILILVFLTECGFRKLPGHVRHYIQGAPPTAARHKDKNRLEQTISIQSWQWAKDVKIDIDRGNVPI